MLRVRERRVAVGLLRQQHRALLQRHALRGWCRSSSRQCFF
jgi:hypothetical protein